eukprot:gene23866-biopygen22345
MDQKLFPSRLRPSRAVGCTLADGGGATAQLPGCRILIATPAPGPRHAGATPAPPPPRFSSKRITSSELAALPEPVAAPLCPPSGRGQDARSTAFQGVHEVGVDIADVHSRPTSALPRHRARAPAAPGGVRTWLVHPLRRVSSKRYSSSHSFVRLERARGGADRGRKVNSVSKRRDGNPGSVEYEECTYPKRCQDGCPRTPRRCIIFMPCELPTAWGNWGEHNPVVGQFPPIFLRERGELPPAVPLVRAGASAQPRPADARLEG